MLPLTGEKVRLRASLLGLAPDGIRLIPIRILEIFCFSSLSPYSTTELFWPRRPLILNVFFKAE